MESHGKWAEKVMEIENIQKSCNFSTAYHAQELPTRAVLRLVWPSILLLFIERWRHLADSNEPNFINKTFFEFIKFNWVTGSPPTFYTLLKCSFNYIEHNIINSHCQF